ncbi:MAG: hypothetical protein KAJ98_12220 [Spirochaetaceae bacterium]|nr:hypothetical protein [Spirochaetaceae bacterium]
MSTVAVNPFTGQAVSTTTIPVPGFLRNWGFRLQESLIEASRSVTSEGDWTALIPALSIAVVFGIVHIIGPGHGKLFTIGYFGSRRAKLSEGLILSALVNILDSLSALLLVGIAYGILSIPLRAAGASTGYYTRLIAYASVALLGTFHLLSHLRSSHRAGQYEKKHLMKPWMLALTVGLIPCPVSSAILAWGIVNHALGFSLLLVMGVSIGGMMSMTLFTFVIIGGKSGLSMIMEKRGLSRILNIIEIVSMAFLVLVGVLLFLTAL